MNKAETNIMSFWYIKRFRFLYDLSNSKNPLIPFKKKEKAATLYFNLASRFKP